MSLATLKSRAQLGTDAPLVTIEVFLSGGLPSFSIVGMAGTAVRESKDRVRSAILSSNFDFPQSRITVSLAPADMPKAGGRFDLAIALGILAAGKQVSLESISNTEIYGELALNGDLRKVPGVLPAALQAASSDRAILVPRENRTEASLARVEARTAANLLQVTAHLSGEHELAPVSAEKPATLTHEEADMADVKGQSAAKRAIEVAAAGGHNLLLVGPPGTGKSMLACRLPGVLPQMTEQEALETAAIDSVLGIPLDLTRWRRRPYRAPHHTASAAAIVGGGPGPQPGEISRAHNGVLFLDELPEFNRNVLEVLREPLETGSITISRAMRQAEFPANVQLVCAMNPCPCGYLGDESGACSCSAESVSRYRGKISGPLLDRIDIQVEVGRPPIEALRVSVEKGERSRDMARRVVAARKRQHRRNGVCNARLAGKALDRHCALGGDELDLLENAVDQFNLSARAYQRVLRVARTIADLADADALAVPHLAEALSLRQLDRRFTGIR